MGFSEVCFMKPKIHVRGRKSELHPRKISHFGATQEVSCCGLVNTKK